MKIESAQVQKKVEVVQRQRHSWETISNCQIITMVLFLIRWEFKDRNLLQSYTHERFLQFAKSKMDGKNSELEAMAPTCLERNIPASYNTPAPHPKHTKECTHFHSLKPATPSHHCLATVHNQGAIYSVAGASISKFYEGRRSIIFINSCQTGNCKPYTREVRLWCTFQYTEIDNWCPILNEIWYTYVEELFWTMRSTRKYKNRDHKSQI